MDEPTSGLDPESAQNVNSLIQEQAAEGITVFLCTHQLRYAQEICTTYGLMNNRRCDMSVSRFNSKGYHDPVVYQYQFSVRVELHCEVVIPDDRSDSQKN